MIGNIDRVEGVDTSRANLNFDRFENIRFSNNSFSNVDEPAENPLTYRHEENSAQTSWNVGFGDRLPFGAFAQTVESVIGSGAIRDASGDIYWGMPYHLSKQGPDRDQITLNWERAVRGAVNLRVRIDDPL